jgi:nascent polypeptide-associated complex subunit alpha
MRINPRELERMARKMGINTQPIEAEEVIIKTPEKDIVIINPQVSKVNMMGQETWQIVGEAEERPKSPFTEQDVKMVVGQTGASEADVRKTLAQLNGDLAMAILKLKKK